MQPPEPETLRSGVPCSGKEGMVLRDVCRVVRGKGASSLILWVLSGVHFIKLSVVSGVPFMILSVVSGVPSMILWVLSGVSFMIPWLVSGASLQQTSVCLLNIEMGPAGDDTESGMNSSADLCGTGMRV